MKKSYAVLLSIAAVVFTLCMSVLWGGDSHTSTIVAGVISVGAIKAIWDYYEKSNDKVVLEESKIDDEILREVYEILNIKEDGVKTYEDFKKEILRDEDGLRYCYNKLTRMGLPVTKFCTSSYVSFKLRMMGVDKYKKEEKQELQ